MALGDRCLWNDAHPLSSGEDGDLLHEEAGGVGGGGENI